MNDATHHRATVNDMQMHYQKFGEGMPLLLLHGFTGAGSDWSYIFNAPPEGYSLIIPDLRGHGQSDNPSNDFTFEQCALDIIALLDSFKIEELSAIGLSGGAQTLLHMTVMQPKRFQKLVLVSTGHYFPEQARAVMNATTFDKISPDELEQLRSKHAFGDEQIKKLYAIVHSFKDSYKDVNFTPNSLATISAKTLIVHGDSDPLYPEGMAIELSSCISESKLWIIPDGGHLPIFGDAITTFRNTVIEFLSAK